MGFNCYAQGCTVFSKPAQLTISSYYFHEAMLPVALILQDI